MHFTVSRPQRKHSLVRGMIGRALYTAASFLCLTYTIDSQPTDKAESVGEDFVRGGQDKTPPKKNVTVTSAPSVVKADTPTATVTKGNE
jgi:hypothetical protein